MSREHWLIPETPFASYQDYLARTGESAALTVGNIGELLALEAAGRQSSSLPAEAGVGTGR